MDSVLQVNHETFVRKKRTGDWHLHLYAVKQMLPSCMLQHIVPTPSLLPTMCSTWKSWTQRSNTCSSLATLGSTAHTNFGVESDMMIQQALMRAINPPGGWGIPEAPLLDRYKLYHWQFRSSLGTLQTCMKRQSNTNSFNPHDNKNKQTNKNMRMWTATSNASLPIHHLNPGLLTCLRVCQ